MIVAGATLIKDAVVMPWGYAGSLTPPDSPSPYGVWGAMGTRSSESSKSAAE